MEWIKSGPEHIFLLRQLDKFMTNHKGFIAGGCFKNLFNQEKIKDVDVFFRCVEDWQDAVDTFNSDEKFTAAYSSENVRAYRHTDSGIPVELVRSTFGTPEEIISKFDFSVTKFAYYKEQDKDDDGNEVLQYKAVYHPQFFEHLHLKRLIIDDQILKPMNAFNRVLKYRHYGFVPCVETKLKLINAIRRLPESEVLVPTNFYEGFD